MKAMIFLFCVITPCISVGVYCRLGGTYRLHLQGRMVRLAKMCPSLVSCSTLKMEATLSSEKLVNFYSTARRYNGDNSTLHRHNCNNLKSNIV
jgi:hypothetical protein